MFSESMRDTPELAKLLRRRQNAQRPGGDIQYVDPVERLGPQRARSQSVAMPSALPQGLPYGPVTPGVPHSSQFTGAVSQQQPISQILPPPGDFAPDPTFSGAIKGPRPSPTMSGGIAMPTGGGTFSPSPMPHPPSQSPSPRPSPTMSGGIAMPQGGGTFSPGGSPAGAPFHQGGYKPPSPYLPVREAPLNLTPYQPTSSALLAALAQAGQRVNPSVGSRSRYQF